MVGRHGVGSGGCSFKILKLSQNLKVNLAEYSDTTATN